MERRQWADNSFAEYVLFKKLRDVSWGVQHKLKLPVTDPDTDEVTEQNVMVYIPMYDALGNPYSHEQQYDSLKLKMRYNIINKADDDYYFDSLKLCIKKNEDSP